jgi:hypothetical protein
MAPGRTRASTVIVQTRPVLSEHRLLLSPARILEPRLKDHPPPPFAGTVLARDARPEKSPQSTSVEVSSWPGSESLHIRYRGLGTGSKNNEPYTMFESPARSWQGGSFRVEVTPEPNACGVTYAYSAPGSPKRHWSPPRQDSAYYSVKDREDVAEINYEVQARQLRARERVQILRMRVTKTRRIKRERKALLRQLRARVTHALDKLTRKINELVALQRLENLQAELSPYYDELRAAQDELGPAEDLYDHLEGRLDEEELDLEEEEDHFYRHFNVLSLDVPDSQLDEELSPLVKPYHPPEGEFQEISLENEKVADYLRKIEEAERLKEGLDDLETDYYRLSVDANFRKRHGIPLSAEHIEFLKSYPEEYKEGLDNLHAVEDALLDLRDECIEQGLFSESEHIYEPRDALYEEVMESVDEARERSSLRVAADHHQESEINFGDKRDYVNKWLLEWVPDSTLDTMMLRAWIYFEYPAHKSADLEGDKWADMAIGNWDNDSAGKFANEFFNASKLDAITGDTADTGNLGAFSTTRSAIYGSLDVDLEDEGRSSPNVQTENGSFTMEKRTLELMSTEENYQQTASMETTPRSLLEKHPAIFAPHPVTKASSLHAFDIHHETPYQTLPISTEPLRRARSAMPGHVSQHPLTINVKTSSLETDLSTLRYGTSSTAELSTPLDNIAQSANGFDKHDHERANNLYSHGNASVLSDLFIPISDVLV